MQVISIRISKLSITLGVTPEVVTQWLYAEFIRVEEPALRGGDKEDEFPTSGKSSRW
jgi:hypothetical protein